jgi:hypothetical protein
VVANVEGVGSVFAPVGKKLILSVVFVEFEADEGAEAKSPNRSAGAEAADE